jgi:hypothetical protein
MPIRRSAFPGDESCEAKPFLDCGLRIQEGLRLAAWACAGRLYKQTQFSRAWPAPDPGRDERCETNPIRQRMAQPRRAIRAKRTQFRPSAREWARAAGAGRPRRGVIVQNEANLGGVSSLKCQVLRRARRAASPRDLSTSDFTLRTSHCGGAAGPIVRNKPNSRSSRYPTIPLFYRSTVPIRRRSCETKPNVGGLRQVGKDGHHKWSAFAEKWNVRNEPNFWRSR